MADPQQRVPIVGPYGERGSVDATDVDAVIKAGGRIATPEEIAQSRRDALSAKQGTAANVIGTATGVVGGVLNPLMASGPAGSSLEGYNRGVASGLTAGLSEGGVRQAVKAVAGEKAAAKFEENSRDMQLANSTAFSAGELAGMVGGSSLSSGAGTAAKFAPSAAVNLLGEGVERAAASGLARMGAGGALGRAGASALSLGARGAAEGALYGAAQQFNEDMLGDKEVAADRLFAATGMGALYGAIGGAVLGGGGSLVKSGAKAGATEVRGGLARMSRTTGRVEDAAAKAESAAVRAETATGSTLADRARTFAVNSADDLAFDSLNTTRKLGDKINAKVPGGTRGVGRYVREELGDQLLGKRAPEIVPLLEANKAAKGALIGEKVAMNDVSFSIAEPLKMAEDIHFEMLKDPTRIQGAEAMRARVAQAFEALQHAEKVGADDMMKLSDLYYTRAKLEAVAHELGPKTAAQDGFKQWLRRIDDMLVNKLDDAAKAAGKAGEGDAIRALKGDYQKASWALRAAEDGANRIGNNNTFGIREGIGAAVGFSMGSPLLGLATAIGGKVVKERGSATGAVLLAKAADLGFVGRIIGKLDDQLGRSSRGLLNPAKDASIRSASKATDPVVAARKAEKRLTELSSRPEKVMERAQTVTQSLSQSAPTVAGFVARNMTKSLAFLNSKLPPMRAIDPLSPYRGRGWSQTEAAKFMRYVEAAEDPQGVLEDVERGKVTKEGIETLKVLAPTLYRDLQKHTLEAIADQLAKGKPIPFETRIKLGTLMSVPADPSLQPKIRSFLQANVVPPPEGSGKTSGGSGAPAKTRPVNIPTQHSALDRLEKGVGKR